MKHTPGPWEAIMESDPRGQPSPMYRGLVALIKHSPDERLSVVTANGSSCDPEQWRANARLIAAAPELLAELEGIAETLDKMSPCPEEILDQLLYRAQAAILKAKGEAA